MASDMVPTTTITLTVASGYRVDVAKKNAKLRNMVDLLWRADGVQEALKGLLPDPKSKTLFTDITAMEDAKEAERYTASIMLAWDCKSAHAMTAIRALATFPDTFHTSVELVLQAVLKYAQTTMLQGSDKLWKSIKKRSGAQFRYFKEFDKTLLQVIATEWLRSMKEGTEEKLDPVPIARRIVAVWTILLSWMPDAWKQRFQADVPNIFASTRCFLSSIVTRRLAVVKVLKCANDRLPAEIVHNIADNLASRASRLFLASTFALSRRKPGEPSPREPSILPAMTYDALTETIAKRTKLGLSLIREICPTSWPMEGFLLGVSKP